MKSDFEALKDRRNSLRRILKRQYITRKFDQVAGELTKNWQIITQTVQNKTVCSGEKHIIEYLKYEERIIEDKQEIANTLNDYLLSIGNKIGEEVEQDNQRFGDMRCTEIRNTNIIFLTPCTDEEIDCIINELNINQLMEKMETQLTNKK